MCVTPIIIGIVLNSGVEDEDLVSDEIHTRNRTKVENYCM